MLFLQCDGGSFAPQLPPALDAHAREEVRRFVSGVADLRISVPLPANDLEKNGIGSLHSSFTLMYLRLPHLSRSKVMPEN